MFMLIVWNYFLTVIALLELLWRRILFLVLLSSCLGGIFETTYFTLILLMLSCYVLLKPFSGLFLYSQSSHSKQILCLLVSSLWSVASSTTSLFSTGLSPDFSISSSQCVLDGGLAFFCRCSYRHLRFLFNDHWWSFNCGFLLGRRRRIQAHGEKEGVGLSLFGQVLAKIHKLSCQARQLTVAFHFQTNLN